ncbi:MAG: hypothetical protein R6X32_02600 [Chloroflexota bacterium]
MIADDGEPRLTAWQRAVTCFERPIVWLAIGLLLLNDHYLKMGVPSWFTGKLSDFAGLFFFPLLLAVLFAPLAEWLRLSFRQSGGVAFGVTAVWFALMKTNSLVNAATIALWELLVWWPVQIVLDPTDLIALVMLWPAWRIWINSPHQPWRTWQQPRQRLPRLLPLTVVAIASLAALATSPAYHEYVLRLALVDDQLYVGTSAYSPEWPASPTEWQWRAYTCNANFDCSKRVPETPELWLVFDQVGAKIACLENDPLLCYRTGHEIVEVSTNGGQTWQVAWQIPPERREYMNRLAFSGPVASVPINMGPHDLLLKLTGNDEHILVAALGNEGLLVRMGDGTWERKSVAGEATPTPLVAADWYEAHRPLAGEFAIWQSLWLFLILIPYAFNRFRRYRLILALFLSTLVCYGLFISFFVVRGLFIFGYLFSIGVAVSIVIWWWDANRQRRAFWCWLSALVMGLVAFIPLTQWSMGTISSYDTALTISLITGTVAILPGGYSAWLGIKAIYKQAD